MGVAVYWRPAADRIYLEVASTSAFVTVMTRAFDKPPWILSKNDINVLSGMAWHEGGPNEENPYYRLVEIIQEHEVIQVLTEY